MSSQSYAPNDRPQSAMAIIAFVLSFFLPIIGAVLGIFTLARMRKNPQGGRGLAIASIVIGGILTLAWILGIAVTSSLTAVTP
jgi:membrane protein YqaA with SNARE-associated domain